METSINNTDGFFYIIKEKSIFCRLMNIFLLSSICTGAYSSLGCFLSQKYSLSDSSIGLFLTLVGAGSFATIIVQSYLNNKMLHGHMVDLGIFLIAISFFILSNDKIDLIVTALSFIAMGLGRSLAHNVFVVSALDASPKDLLSHTSVMNSFFVFIGSGIGTLLMGNLIGLVGFLHSFLILSIIIGSTFLIRLFFVLKLSM